MSEERDKLAEDYVNKKYTKHQTIWFAPADLIHEASQNFKAGWDAREDEVKRLKDLLKIAEDALEESRCHFCADYGGVRCMEYPACIALSQLRASTEGEK